MDEPHIYDLIFETSPQSVTAQRDVQRGSVGKKIFVFAEHLREFRKIIGIQQTTACGAMRGNGGDAAFQGQPQDFRILIIPIDNLQRIFSARMGQKRQSRLGHFGPEGFEGGIAAIDVLAVGEGLHHNRAVFEAAIEFVEGIRAGGMDGDGGEKFGMFAGELEDEVVGHVGVAAIGDDLALCVINGFLSEEANDVDVRCANVFKEFFSIEIIEISRFEAGNRQPQSL